MGLFLPTYVNIIIIITVITILSTTLSLLLRDFNKFFPQIIIGGLVLAFWLLSIFDNATEDHVYYFLIMYLGISAVLSTVILLIIFKKKK
jgi:hypothetical protein